MKRAFATLFLVMIALVVLAACGAPGAPAEGGGEAAAPAASTGGSGLPVDVPRENMFVLDQILRYSVMNNYNFWRSGPQEPNRHAMMMETLWYRDQETGEMINGLASAPPVYNEDYTQMNVDLRDNIYWTDGTQFTADDVVYTVQTLYDTPELNNFGWSAQLNIFLDSVEKTGDFSVQFNLVEANPRFHSLFETRWNGIYMMPKHIFEEIDDLVSYTYSDPVILGNYLPVQTDPNGYWELFQRREDWERSPAGVIVGKPGPEYILTIFYGDSAKKAIAMSRGELDVYFDVDIESFETTLDTTPTARSWYEDFPWAYPNEVSTRMFAFNFESETQPYFQNKDVRWALALALDIVDLQTEYIGGVAKVTPMAVPPTSSLTRIYLDPMEEWFNNLEIDLGDGEMYQPYDPTVPDQIAAWAEGQGYTVPGTPREVFGTGWWNFDPEAAEKLLLKAGFSRDNGGDWLTPEGEQWTIELQAATDENDAFRMANAAADMWQDFGIDVNLQGLERSVWETNMYTGQFEISVPWRTFVLASGDSWPETSGIHPRYHVPVGEDSRSKGGATYISGIRLQDPKIGEFIDAMAPLEGTSEENFAVATDFLKYWTENMYFITAISFKKFVTWDERYWTGFPTAENPIYMPLYWFQGGKFALQSLEPVE